MPRDTHPLAAEARACRLCAAHLPHGPRPVFQFHPAARILIAGQAPGARVHASGVPFDDPSGERLRDWLGVDRDTFYDPQRFAILPMGFCFPGSGRNGDLPPRPECADTWRRRFMDALPQLELTLTLGQFAMAWHLESGRQALTDVVRDWRRHWPAVVPLPHPSPRNNRWLAANPWFADEVLPALGARVREILSAS
ncbi:MAG: uracil-DNA glycosylase family protein [Rhodocyclaceae bacterium]|nr:uracil-DNA glycosylase family protein [Rhodocyclaceae bacterium]